MKKILGIVGFLIIITALGIGAYYYFVFDETDPQTGEKVSFREFMPFGSSNTAPQREVGSNTGDEEPRGENNIPSAVTELGDQMVFKAISDGPVAGSVIIGTGTSTKVRYVERATGHVYDYLVHEDRTERVTNTTIPKVREAIWHPDGESAIIRYLKNDTDIIESMYARIVASSSDDGLMELAGVFLEPDIDSVAILGTSGNMFYLKQTPSGDAVGHLASLNGSTDSVVFQSKVREWTSGYAGGASVSLATKPGSYAPGHLYVFDSKTQTVDYILGPATGLTAALNPQATRVLYSEDVGGHFLLKTYDLKSGTTTEIELSSVAEKCVWMKNGTTAFCGAPRARVDSDFLDLWHQGVVSSSDNIWIIEVPSGSAVPFLVPSKQADVELDITDMAVSSDGEWVTLIDKKTLKLWIFRITDSEVGD